VSMVLFWRWATERNVTACNPAIGLPRVPVTPPAPRPLAEDVYRQTVAVCQEPMIELMIRLAGECGLRRAEIVQVHARDLTRGDDGWWIRVHGKGGRERAVPIMADLAVACRTTAGGGWCFPGQIGGHMSPGWAGKLAARVLPTCTGLHTLRHRYATCIYRATGDIVAVQQLLGHSSLATTQRYVAIGDDRLRRAAAAAA